MAALPAKNTWLIVNPHAGKGKGRRCFAALQPELVKKFPGLAVRFSDYPGHSVRIGEEARLQGVERILTIGGDGTPFEVINGVYAAGRPTRAIEFGMIPAGTGNSFIRDFSPPSPARALDNIMAGRLQKIDLIEFSYRRGGQECRQYFLNILGVGLIADILKLTNEKLKVLGPLGYSVAVLARLARKMRNVVSLAFDGEKLIVHRSALVVSNSKFTGGKMKIAPQADAQDGRADLVVFNDVNRREILQIFGRVFSGTHTRHPKVLCRRVRELAIDADPPQLLMADGELLGETPARLKVLPGELTVLL